MSVPQTSKKTTHSVLSVTYDTVSMKYLVIANILLSVLMLFIIVYTVNIVGGQNQTIAQLSKTVNQLSQKLSQRGTQRIDSFLIEEPQKKNHNLILEHIETHFEFNMEEMNKIRIELKEIKGHIQELSSKFAKTAVAIEVQSKSSWEMKKIIESIRKKIEYFTKLIENIGLPQPDFAKMKDSIHGTFSDIKTKLGGMFSSEQESSSVQGSKQQKSDRQGTQKQPIGHKEIFGSIKDRIKRKWQQVGRTVRGQTQL